MGVPARPLGEPIPDDFGFMGGVIVHDDMNIEITGHIGLDPVEKLAELPRPVTAKALADDLAGGDVEGGEQRGRAVAFVIVAAPLDLARTQG